MATTTSQSPSSKSTDRPGVPFRSTSQNYINAQQSSPQSTTDKETFVSPVKIPDGRRDSKGAVVFSPTETWRPNIGRKQSWSQQDLKREMLQAELGEKRDEGQGTGFTEGGEGSRRV